MVSDFINELKERFKRYRDTSKLKDWLDNNFERTQSFINDRAQTVIFGGMDDAFGWNSNLVDRHMYRVITTVAVINASLAALPGKIQRVVQCIHYITGPHAGTQTPGQDKARVIIQHR